MDGLRPACQTQVSSREPGAPIGLCGEVGFFYVVKRV